MNYALKFEILVKAEYVCNECLPLCVRDAFYYQNQNQENYGVFYLVTICNKQQCNNE